MSTIIMIIILILAIRLIILGIDINAVFKLRKNQENMNKEIKKSGYKKKNIEFTEQIKSNVISVIKLLIKPLYYDNLYNKLSQEALLNTYDKTILEKLNNGELIKEQIPRDEIGELRNRKRLIIDATPHKARKIYDEYGDIKYDTLSPIELADINPFVEIEKEESVQEILIEKVKDEEVNEDTIINADLPKVIELHKRIGEIIDYRERIEHRKHKTEVVLRLTQNDKAKDKKAA